MTENVSDVLARVEWAAITPVDNTESDSRKDVLRRNKKILKKIDWRILDKIDSDRDDMSVRDLISFKDSAAKQIAILEGDSIDPNWPKVIPSNIVINVLTQVNHN